jgi:hypothetical protein
MRRARFAVGLAFLAVGALIPSTAAAHPAGAFDACVTQAGFGECGDTFSYLYGDTVILRGTVASVHDEAIVLRKAPGSNRWERVDTVAITDAGRMIWRWRTHRHDAVQDAPYLLRFTIPGHGRSDVVEAYVLFGE